MASSYEQLRDWVYENYQASYIIGTGLLALGAWALDPQKRTGAVMAGYVGALAVGALLEPCVNVTNQQYGEVLCRGRLTERRIALTFDDGPNPQYTPQILDILAREKVPASFFCVGEQACQQPELLLRIHQEGHLVGTHSMSHRNLLTCTPSQSYQQIAQGAQVIADIIGQPTKFFRPPYGQRYPWTLLQARSLGLTPVLWSNCPRDWQMPGHHTIVRRLLNNLLPGDIVLLHDGGGDRSQTVKALPILIRLLRSSGYTFVRADQM